MSKQNSIQQTIKDLQTNMEDEVASKAVRKSTLKSIKVKKQVRLRQLKQQYENEVQEINIQYAEDPARLKAKYAAEEYAKTEKKKKRAQKSIAHAKELIELDKKSRRLTLSEEIASSIVQGIAACLFIAGTTLLDTIALSRLTDYVAVTAVMYSTFGGFMILMYLFSLLSHALTNITAKRVFNRLSHIWAFLNIGLGYSVYTITKIEGLSGWILFGIVWGLILIGVLFYAIAGKKYTKINIILYILAGFSGIAIGKPLYDVLSTVSFSMLVLAAVFYLVGIVFYNLKKIKYMHFIGNLFMLAGSIYIFFSMLYI